MVQDLMRRYHLVGMSRQEIHSLLGKPDSTIETIYHYFLCPDGGGDAIVLELDFNKQGRVSSAKICSN